MQTEGSSALKRRLQIVDLVRKDDVVRVEDLSAKLGVSSVTIRTDLNYLEQQGYVIRAFGKARYNPTLGAALPRKTTPPFAAVANHRSQRPPCAGSPMTTRFS
jgi:DeoR family transcriptional regulator of aga operon